jgi:hypothetical protein
MSIDEIWELERGFWLGGADVYERHLGPEALIVFPAPVGMLERAATIESIRHAARWTGVSFSRQRCIVPTVDLAVLAYAVEADRGTAESRYRAQCTSTYVRLRAAWKLVMHQQCPG